jgi:hypothetical protein
MRTGKILTWRVSLALGSLLFLTLASQAQEQATDLCLPPVHTTWFVTVRIPATGTGPLGDGTLYPGVTFPNGAQSGVYYVDQTQHKLKIVFYGPDGVTPVSGIWQDFNLNAQVQYNYDYQTGVCTKSNLTISETPICIAQNVTEVASFSRSDFYVATSPGHSVEASMEENSLSKPLFFLRRDGTNTAEMRFYNFTSAPIPPAQFDLPANCTP